MHPFYISRRGKRVEGGKYKKKGKTRYFAGRDPGTVCEKGKGGARPQKKSANRNKRFF